MTSHKLNQIAVQKQKSQEMFPGATSLKQPSYDFDEEFTSPKSAAESDLQRKKNITRIQKTTEKTIKKQSSRLNSAKRSEGDGKSYDGKSHQSIKATERENMKFEEELRSEINKDLAGFNFDNDGAPDQRSIEPMVPGRLDIYGGEEDDLVCCRFPHLDFDPMPIDVNEIRPVEIYENIFLGPFQAALCTKTLLTLGITHVLNVSAMEYTKRYHYFKYLNLDLYDVHEEDIKKFFRITNRFITEALSGGGKLLIHSFEGKSRAPAFALAYLIGRERLPMKRGLEVIKSHIPEIDINPYFLKQIEQYDLEKLAIMNVPK